MVNKNMLKKGFSLAEALVSMLVLSVFFLATYKIMSQKEPDDIVTIPHGFFECYYDNGQLKQGYSIAGEATQPTDVNGNSCSFSPQKVAAYYTVSIIPSSNENNVHSASVYIANTATIIPPNSGQEANTATFTIDNESKIDSLNPVGTRQNYLTLLRISQPNTKCIDDSVSCILIEW